jgi:hypothetical protein
MNNVNSTGDPIRPVVLPFSLSELTGPTGGMVELPLHVDWTPTNRYDLSVPQRMLTMYRTVLLEARGASDLHYLNSDTLQSCWAELRLPVRISKAWEAQFPELTDSPSP